MNRSERTGWLLAVVVLVLAGCGGGGGGGGSGDGNFDNSVSLIVQQTLPTDGEEVSSSLVESSGAIRLKFSAPVAPGTILDPNNQFNGLTSYLNILDSTFSRVPGTPRIEEGRGNEVTLFPAGGVLSNGQYTVTATRQIRSTKGEWLNRGRSDYRSSFTVGPDIWKPVIRATYPVSNQSDVPRHSQIVITFNEALDPSTVTAGTLVVRDGGHNPPAPINGMVSLSPDGFEMVFTPDPEKALPANSTVVVTVIGGASGISDMRANTFEGDPASPGTYQFQFETIYEPPDPNVPPPVDVLTPDGALYYSTGTSVGAVSATAYEYGRSITDPDPTNWGIGNPVPYSERKVGAPTAMIVDPRLDPTDGHTVIYVIDDNRREVVLVSTRNMKVLTRWGGFAWPRDFAIHPSGKTLYVTDYSSNIVVAIDSGSYNPGASVATEAMRDAGKAAYRKDIEVGLGPIGAAHFPDRDKLLVANSLSNSVTEINTMNGTVTQELKVDASPYDIATTDWLWFGHFAWITCRQGGGDKKGAVAMYWIRPNQRRSSAPHGLGQIQSILSGLDDPTDVQYDYSLTTNITGVGIRGVFIVNSNSTTITKSAVYWMSAGYTTTFLPTLESPVQVGKRPTKLAIDPVSPAIMRRYPVLICALQGEGALAFIDAEAMASPHFHLSIPGVRGIVSYWDQ